MLLNDCKAGMQDIDKIRIESIIRQNTGTNYYSHQQKKQQRIDERIDRNRQLLETTTVDQLAIAERKMDMLVDRLETSRDMSQTIVHVDMDAFYAAVEMRDNAQLRTIPMAVGGDSMLTTSNYLARRYGVRAAMPGFIARKLCPQLVIVPCDFDKYRMASKMVRSIFVEYDPNYSMASLDEAYLDLTNCLANRVSSHNHRRVRYAGDCLCRLPRIDDPDDDHSMTTMVCDKCGHKQLIYVDEVQFGCNIESIVAEMRFRVEQLTGLTCSAGIAPNGMLAKVCSDKNKPNGQYYLRCDIDAIRDFLQNLPIRKVNGIGAVSEHLLKAIGIDKCGQLYDKRAELSVLFGDSTAEYLMRVCLGSGSTTTNVESTNQEKVHERKSISISRTFAPTNDVDQLISICKSLCDTLADDVNAKNIKAKTLTLKLKLSSFDVRTRNISSHHAISSAVDIYTYAEQLMRKEIADNSSLDLRLIGIRLSNLISSCDNQLDIRRYVNDHVEDKHQTDIRRYFNDQEDDNECAICPVCCESTIPIRQMNQHIDKCLLMNNTSNDRREQVMVQRSVKRAATSSSSVKNTATSSSSSVKRNGTSSSSSTKTKTRCLESYFIRR